MILLAESGAVKYSAVGVAIMTQLESLYNFVLDMPKCQDFFKEFFRACFHKITNPVFMENIVETLPSIMTRMPDDIVSE